MHVFTCIFLIFEFSLSPCCHVGRDQARQGKKAIDFRFLFESQFGHADLLYRRCFGGGRRMNPGCSKCIQIRVHSDLGAISKSILFFHTSFQIWAWNCLMPMRQQSCGGKNHVFPFLWCACKSFNNWAQSKNCAREPQLEPLVETYKLKESTVCDVIKLA